MGVSVLLLIAGAICLSGALVSAFRWSTTGLAFAYLGMMAVRQSACIRIDSNLMLFWAVATLILLVVRLWTPHMQPVSQTGRNYIVGGALVGMLPGVLLGYAEMIIGSVIGAFLGLIAWRRTPKGSESRVNTLKTACEVGLPAVVTMSMIGLTLLGFIGH